MKGLQKNSGFSLLEILAIVAIIGVTAALLFPVFAEAKENGKKAQETCLSNMKQMSLGLMMYVDDYDGVFPTIKDNVYFKDENGVNAQSFAGKLLPYLRNARTLVCPLAKNIKLSDIGSIDTRGKSCGKVSYFGNGVLMMGLWDKNNTCYRKGVFTGHIEMPAKVISVTEYPKASDMVLLRPAVAKYEDKIMAKYVGPSWGQDIAHENGQNVCFSDGHARFCNANTLTYENYGVSPSPVSKPKVATYLKGPVTISLGE